MNELKVQEALQSVGTNVDSENNERQDKWAFITLFKRKYLELTDFEFRDNITPINQVNINRVIQDLKREGDNYVDNTKERIKGLFTLW